MAEFRAQQSVAEVTAMEAKPLHSLVENVMTKPSQSVAEGSTKPTPSNVEVATAFIEAITAGDIDGMAALMTEDFVWRLLPAALGVPAKNKREYLLQSKDLGCIFAYLNIGMRAPLDVVEAGDAVVMHVMCDGLLATGAEFQNECILIFRCEGGRVRRATEFMDSETIRRALEAGDGAGFKLVRKTYDESE
ncbi:hypothetical protein B0H19DRAFT_1265841 [Mycena capillaripes]|nr:hypothetical protein B0H19DRAFT_1265841 [Mycena capillaripes]